MEEFNIVPIYRNGMDEISDGIDIPIPDFCRIHCKENEKCKRYYRELERSNNGIHVCPFGFSSFVFESNGDKVIFTCLRVDGEYDRKILIPKIKSEPKEYREISLEDLKKYADAYTEFNNNQTQYNDYKKFIDNIFHDIRKFNQQIKLKNDRIYRRSQQHNKHNRMGDIFEASKGIQEISWFLSLRLNNHDFIYNENLMSADVKSSYNIYKIIDKVRMCIKERADSKGINIRMNAKAICRDIQAYDCIELLPFLIIDNAIKYSPKGETINVNVTDSWDKQYVSIISTGPYVDENEINKITDQGYRGNNAIKVTDDGMGIGLYTAARICELNNIKLNIVSVPTIKNTINGIPYSEFSVDLCIDL